MANVLNPAQASRELAPPPGRVAARRERILC